MDEQIDLFDGRSWRNLTPMGNIFLVSATSIAHVDDQHRQLPPTIVYLTTALSLLLLREIIAYCIQEQQC
jgi:hypothetical protein